MEDFLKAVEWMKEGKKVRRKIWGDKNAYWYLKYPEYIHSDIMCNIEDVKEDRVVDYFSPDLFQAKDWQIYKNTK